MAFNREVRRESTGWRDAAISARHRMYGWDVPAVDIDFLMVEYDGGKPQALIEYKTLGAQVPDETNKSIAAIRELANAYPVPFLIVFYDSSNWSYCVFAGNEAAVEFLKSRRLVMCEQSYVQKLYALRRRATDMDVLRKCHTAISDQMMKWVETLKAKAS